jgi:hypothetical protein
MQGLKRQCPLTRALFEALKCGEQGCYPSPPLLKALLLFGSFFLGLLLCFRHDYISMSG